MKTTQEMIEIMQAFVDGKQVERRVPRLSPTDWFLLAPNLDPNWNWGQCDYRIAETPDTIPDTIDWDHVAEGYNWMARNCMDNVLLFKEKPVFEYGGWYSWDVLANCFASYKRGTVGWQDSLVERPKGGGK